MASTDGELQTVTSEDFGFKPLGKLELLPSYEEQLPFSQLQNFAISSKRKIYAAASRDKVISGSLQELRDHVSNEKDENSQPLSFLWEKQVKDVVFVGFTHDGKYLLCITLIGAVLVYNLEEQKWSDFRISTTTELGLNVTSAKLIPGILDAILVQSEKELYHVFLNGETTLIHSQVASFDTTPRRYAILSNNGAVELHDALTREVIFNFSTPAEIATELADEYIPLSISVLSDDHYLIVFGNAVSATDEDVNYDHKMYFVSVSGDREISYRESFDIAPAFGTVLRNPFYYHLDFYDITPTTPHLYIITSACTSELTILDDNEVIQPNQDSDRAVLPISQDTDNDTNPIGLALDIVTSGIVAQPCQGVDIASDLPLIYVLNNEGTLQVFALFHCSSIKAGNFKCSNTLKYLEQDSTFGLGTNQENAGLPPMVGSNKSAADQGAQNTKQGKDTDLDSVTPTNGANSSSTNTPEKPSASSKNPSTETPAFGQGTASPFGQPAFGQPTFGKSLFDDSTGSKDAPTFGGISTSIEPTFGSNKTTTLFGQAGFGTSTSVKPAFGSANDVNNTPAFGQTGFGTSTSVKPAFGSANDVNNTPAFGQTGFGSSTSVKPAFGSANDVNNTPAFGQTGFGTSTSAKFAFGSTDSNTEPSKSDQTGFGGFASAKPAFGSLKNDPSSSPFGQPSFGKPLFGSSEAAKPLFGATNFGDSSFGKPAFGSLDANSGASAFGQPTFGLPDNKSKPSQPPAFGLPPTTANINEKANASSSSQSNPQNSSVIGTNSDSAVFGKPSFGQASTPSSQNVFGKPTFGQLGTSSSVATPTADQPPKPLFGKNASSTIPSFNKSDSPFSSFAKNESPFAQINSSTSPFNKGPSPFKSSDNASPFATLNEKLSEQKALENPFSKFTSKESTTHTPITGQSKGELDSEVSLVSSESFDLQSSSDEEQISEDTEPDVLNESDQSESDTSSESAEISLEAISVKKSGETDISSLTERIKKVANLSTEDISNPLMAPSPISRLESPQGNESAFSKFSDTLKSSPTPSFSFAQIGKGQATQETAKTDTVVPVNDVDKGTRSVTDKDKDTLHKSVENINDSIAVNPDNENDSSIAQSGEGRSPNLSDENIGKKPTYRGHAEDKNSVLISEDNNNSKEESLEEVDLDPSGDGSEEFSVETSVSSDNSEKRAGTLESESFDELDDLKEELEQVKKDQNEIKLENVNKESNKTSSNSISEATQTHPAQMTSNETQTHKNVADIDIQTDTTAVTNFAHTSFENDEAYLVMQNIPRNLENFYTGANLLKIPHQSSNETMRRIETTFYMVSAELSVLEENIENMGLFIDDQCTIPFKRSKETIHQNYSWRMAESSTLRIVMEDALKQFQETKEDVSTMSSEIQEFLEQKLLSTKELQFQLKDQFGQLKYLHEEHNNSIRDLPLQQSRMQSQLRRKLGKVRESIRQMEDMLRVLKLHTIKENSTKELLVKKVVGDNAQNVDLLEAIQSLRREVAELKITGKHEKRPLSVDNLTKTAAITELGLQFDTKKQIGQYFLSRNT